MTIVKALEWKQTHETTWAADTIIGWYHIDRRQAPGKDSIFYWKRSGENLKPCDTLEAAKAAAQADYEARILSALTPAPDLASENERLRAALEAVNAAASKEYCASLRQFEEKECLGWEAKVAAGNFGKAEHEAHKRANMLMGKAQGLWEAAKIARAALERT